MRYANTFTIIAGNKNCTYNCDICISKMTPDYGIGTKEVVVDWDKFDLATKIAKNYNANHVLITGKGEPTLYPAQITKYLRRLQSKGFDRIELQTNGSEITKGRLMSEFLDVWQDLGLTTIAISIFHYDNEKNKQAFKSRNGQYPDLKEVIETIHKHKMNTRLSCVMLEGYVDSVEEVRKLIDFAKQERVFQLSLRSVDKPSKSLDLRVSEFIEKNRLKPDKLKEITDYLETNGNRCDILPHGAVVYEVDGQNVCLTTGLSQEVGKEESRQLIFFPQGWLTTSWENVMGGRLI